MYISTSQEAFMESLVQLDKTKKREFFIVSMATVAILKVSNLKCAFTHLWSFITIWTKKYILLKKIKIPIEFYRKLPQIFRPYTIYPKESQYKISSFMFTMAMTAILKMSNPKYTSKGSFLRSFLKGFFRNIYKKKKKKKT